MMDFLEAMQSRFACKRYDTAKPLSDDEITQILEYGRLTPTSFGLEPWSFHAVISQEKLKELYWACFEQETVSSSGMTVAVLVRTESYVDPDGEMVAQRGVRFPPSLEYFIDDYRPYWEYLISEGRVASWLRAQAYLGIANMMTGARMLGIQSCAIEGFDEANVLKVLGQSPEQWQVGLLASFGHPAEETRPKIRLSLDELVTYY